MTKKVHLLLPSMQGMKKASSMASIYLHDIQRRQINSMTKKKYNIQACCNAARSENSIHALCCYHMSYGNVASPTIAISSTYLPTYIQENICDNERNILPFLYVMLLLYLFYTKKTPSFYLWKEERIQWRPVSSVVVWLAYFYGENYYYKILQAYVTICIW